MEAPDGFTPPFSFCNGCPISLDDRAVFGSTILTLCYCVCLFTKTASTPKSAILTNRTMFNWYSAAPFWSSVPTFQEHISIVVAFCAQEQVFRIDTLTIIASMTNAHPRGNRTKVKHPRNAVCIDHFVFYLERTIPRASSRASNPFPAPWSLLHFGPKSILN